MMDISVVIPTRDRFESLNRCLTSLTAQTHFLREVIVVDASDRQLDVRTLTEQFPTLRLVVLREEASVCKQRNRGIAAANGTHILLCDDDIELPPNYVSALVDFLLGRPDCGAITGVILEPLDGGFRETISQNVTVLSLCWKFLFQLTVWTDLSAIRSSALGRIVLDRVRAFYHTRNNTFTIAGWPLVTQVSGDHFRTAIFGLGAALVRRDWLLASPFDEILDVHGIGDNYGVAIRFPGDLPIVVLRRVSAIHHRSGVNRLPATSAYYRRILALHYFMSRSRRFTLFNRLMLLWSLIGNLVPQVIHLDFNRARATVKAALLISTGRNPYLRAARLGANSPVTPNP